MTTEVREVTYRVGLGPDPVHASLDGTFSIPNNIKSVRLPADSPVPTHSIQIIVTPSLTMWPFPPLMLATYCVGKRTFRSRPFLRKT